MQAKLANLATFSSLGAKNLAFLTELVQVELGFTKKNQDYLYFLFNVLIFYHF